MDVVQCRNGIHKRFILNDYFQHPVHLMLLHMNTQFRLKIPQEQHSPKYRQQSFTYGSCIFFVSGLLIWLPTWHNKTLKNKFYPIGYIVIGFTTVEVTNIFLTWLIRYRSSYGNLSDNILVIRFAGAERIWGFPGKSCGIHVYIYI